MQLQSHETAAKIVDYAPIADTLETNIAMFESMQPKMTDPHLVLMILPAKLMNIMALRKLKADIYGTGTDARTAH